MGQRWETIARCIIVMALGVAWCVPMLSVRVRAAGMTFVVDTTADPNPSSTTPTNGCAMGHAAGACTLREAILEVNATDPGAGYHHTIDFNVPSTDASCNGTTGICTIAPAFPWPPANIQYPVAIDGYSQQGAQANSLTVGDNAVLKIELSGANAPYGFAGLTFSTGSAGSSVRGLAIDRWSTAGGGGYGIDVQQVANVTIAGNFIGLDPTGAPFGNGNIAVLLAATTNTTIGGTTPADRNVIAGNAVCAISLSGTTATATFPSASNTVQGNYIGVGPDGITARANGKGVQIIDGSQNNFVGGTAAGAGNVISGNSALGVFMDADPSAAPPSGNVIAGNLIGTNATGTAAVGNGTSNIQIQAGTGNTIGDTAPGTRNVISGATRHGVVLYGSSNTGNTVQGNFIGTDATGTGAIGNLINGVYVLQGASGNMIGGTADAAANVIANSGGAGVVVTDTSSQRNAILGNRVYRNTGIGIDLGNDGVTPNHIPQSSGASGPNDFQNYPVLTAASGTSVSGTLTSTPNDTYRIELFATPANARQGQTFLAATTAMADSNGSAPFTATVPTLTVGQFVTATATDVTTGSTLQGDTSEFSAPLAVTASGPAPTITAISPSSGDVRAGGMVTITGTGFIPGQTTLTVDGASVTPTTVTATQIRFVAPMHAAGSVTVVVTVNGQSATMMNAYTYGVVNARPAPAATAVATGSVAPSAPTHTAQPPTMTTPLPQPTRH